MDTVRLTVSQALIRFLKNQYVRRDGKEVLFISGMWGIFGHGNVAGIAQALHEDQEMPFYLARNEQAMTHTAIAYAKSKNRMQAFACTASVGPGSTNMITGAATATINRIPLLLLPSDIFARRNTAPVLQQLEHPASQDVSVNDAFKPVSRYWDRINRPEQLPWALLEAMRVLTSPDETGTVTLCFPEDVQAEAADYPLSFFNKRVWTIPRQKADAGLFEEAIQVIQSAKKPLIIAGGGVLYSEAAAELQVLARETGIPVCETHAGKGSMACNLQQHIGSIGATGTSAANETALEADVILLLGTRLSDFTTASKSQFQHPYVKFIHVNVCSMDAHKLSALPLQADARATIQDMQLALSDYSISDEYHAVLQERKKRWDEEYERVTTLPAEEKLQQPNVLRAVNEAAGAASVVICAAGSLPGDLHKLWKTFEPGGYHLEYGNSCMGYEIAGGIGVKMAKPDKDVYVMVGDGSYLMLSSELITAVQEGIKMTVVLLDNHGYGSIGSLSESVGSAGFGTHYRYRKNGKLEGEHLPMDFVMNAKSYGVGVHSVNSHEELEEALEAAKKEEITQVIVVPVDKVQRVPGYSSWWDVPVAEISDLDSVNQARKEYDEAKKRQRNYF